MQQFGCLLAFSMHVCVFSCACVCVCMCECYVTGCMLVGSLDYSIHSKGS